MLSVVVYGSIVLWVEKGPVMEQHMNEEHSVASYDKQQSFTESRRKQLDNAGGRNGASRPARLAPTPLFIGSRGPLQL